MEFSDYENIKDGGISLDGGQFQGYDKTSLGR